MTLSTSEILKKYGITANKRLGQNFILDDNVTSKIVRLAGIEKADAVIEIGPGPGSLTRHLISAAGKVTVIEKDKRFIEILSAEFGEQLNIIEADALEADFPSLATCHLPLETKIVSNLPYNISTPILVSLLKNITHFKSMTLMFQKEVADRIRSEAGNKDYGRLSVLVQWLCSVEKLMTLPPDVFTPKPKINSTVLKFTPKANPVPADFSKMELVLKHAFGQRRKMLRSSLKGIVKEEAIIACGISPESRAEDISFEGFVKLSHCI